MEEKYGFTKMTATEFRNWLTEKKVARTILFIQQHHTYIPGYSHFTGSNHFELQRNMQASHVRDNGWADIAQHFTIFPDGAILTGRPLESHPAGIKFRNAEAICIENLGYFDTGFDIMTNEQATAIVQGTAILCDRFRIPANTEKIIYHHWFNPNDGKRDNGASNYKSCPGTNFFGGNKVADCEVNFIPKVKAAMGKKSLSTAPKVHQYAQVTAGALNLRQGPGTTWSFVPDRDPALNGAILRVFAVRNNWYKISASEEHWVSGRYTVEVQRAKVTAKSLNVRSLPSTAGQIAFALTEGEEVFVSAEKNNWCRIALNDLWVSKSYLKFL